MAVQFDLYRTTGGVLVVVLQSDLLDELRTRVVAPLLPAASPPRAIGTLNPTLEVDGREYMVAPQIMATLTLSELGVKVGTAASHRDRIIRAVDALLSGI